MIVSHYRLEEELGRGGMGIVYRPSARYAHAAALHADLVAAHARLTRPTDPAWRRPAVLIPIALLVLAVGALGIWQTVQARRARWAREQAIPEVERLLASGQKLAAVRLAADAERYAPAYISRLRDEWYPVKLAIELPGAAIEARDYLDLEGPWVSLGTSPLAERRMPYGNYRFRMTKPGYAPIEMAAGPGARRVRSLTMTESSPPGMVAVSGGPFSVGVSPTVTLSDFWIDRLEVSNREFKRVGTCRQTRTG